MRSVIHLSHQFRFMVVALAAGLMVLGITQLRTMPVDVLPEFSPPSVEIQTESLGLSADEVEQLITVPMEQDLLLGIPWLESMRSESVPGLSSVVLVFQPGTDLMRARQMVTERMTQAVALPHVSKPPTVLQPLSATSRVMIVGLSSKSLSLIQLGVLARWTIAPRLMGVPGVANVSVWGQQDRQIQVLVDPNRMRAQNVSLLNVLQTAGNALWVSTLSFVEASTPGTGGFVDTPNQRLGIRHISPIVTAEGLAQVPISDVKTGNGAELRLGDVANVVEDHQPLIGDAVVDNGAGLLLVIEKFPGTNTLDVTHGVDEALTKMQPGLTGVTVNPAIYRPVTFIEQALGYLSWALILGYALMVIVLGAFLWSWRVALIGAVVIPLSLLIAVLALFLGNASMNVISLAGLLVAIGVVVDEAVIDVDNVRQQLQQSNFTWSAKTASSTILEALFETRSTIVFATVITVVIALPIFFLEGPTGSFFHPLALSYVLAVFAAMVVALTVTAALSFILLTNAPLERRESPLTAWLKRVYAAGLAATVERPRLAVVSLVALLLVGLALMPMVGLSILPGFKERDVLIHLTMAPGTSQPETSRIAALVSRELRSIPGVRDIGAHIGRAVRGDQVVGVHSGELWVNIDPAANYDKTTAAIQRVIHGYPGVRLDAQTYLDETGRDVVAAPKNAITVRVYGDTDEVLRAKADDVNKAIGGITGIVNSRVAYPTEQLTVEAEVDIARAQHFGLKPGDVRRAAATLLSGIQVGNLFEEQKIFDVVVWSTPETRHSFSSINDLLIDTPDGRQVRLGDVARVRIVPTPSVIRHEGVKRYFDVVAEVQGRDLGSAAADVKARLSQVPFPLEYHAEVLGDYVSTQTASAHTAGAVLVALIGILFLLQAAFGSWRLAALTLVTSPVALVGGLVANAAVSGTVSLGSLLGFLVVLGVTVRNSVALIKHWQRLERDEGMPFGLKLVTRGTGERLLPILTTVCATGVAFLPALFFGDVPGMEIARPIAIVLLGGLVTATLLNLFIVPALYLKLAIKPAPDLELYPDGGVVRPRPFAMSSELSATGSGS
jgi:CzcA family heavy metal efflux pump